MPKALNNITILGIAQDGGFRHIGCQKEFCSLHYQGKLEKVVSLGLMYFGREALGKKNIKVSAMPKMKAFLTNNGSWSQLVDLQNIVFSDLQKDSTISVTNSLKVTPFLVPHRDEFSQTVGYKIEGENKTALFIPDIDKWHKWKQNIIEEVKKVDIAFLKMEKLTD